MNKVLYRSSVLLPSLGILLICTQGESTLNNHKERAVWFVCSALALRGLHLQDWNTFAFCGFE